MQQLVRRLVLAISFWLVLALVILSGWGWDRVGSFLEECPRVSLLAVWLALSIYGACRSARTSSSGGKKEIREHRRVLWIIFPVLVLWFVYLPHADRYGIGTYSSPWMRWLGVAIFAASFLLRTEAIRAQGKQFSMAVAIQPEHKLTTAGPYRRVRHPAYLGVMGMVVGISLVFANLIAGLVMTLINWVWLNARIRDEETLLQDEFGEEFAAYRSRTKKLFPFVY
jgi:protein-S-isoprenylcysteine O-methyltransferase Ste14